MTCVKLQHCLRCSWSVGRSSLTNPDALSLAITCGKGFSASLSILGSSNTDSTASSSNNFWLVVASYEARNDVAATGPPHSTTALLVNISSLSLCGGIRPTTIPPLLLGSVNVIICHRAPPALANWTSSTVASSLPPIPRCCRRQQRPPPRINDQRVVRLNQLHLTTPELDSWGAAAVLFGPC